MIDSMETSSMLDSACFDCNELKYRSFLASTYFQKLIYFELPVDKSSEARLFCKSYPASSCMWTNLKALFSEVKKNFFIIKGLSVDCDDSIEEDLSSISIHYLRIDIVRVLKYFLTKVQEMKQLNSKLKDRITISGNKGLDRMLMLLLAEIKGLLLFVGPVSSVPGISNFGNYRFNDSKAAYNFHQYYHLVLDIWFLCLAIVYSMCLMLPKHLDFDVFCQSFEQLSLFSQLSALLIFDFTCLFLNRYKNTNACKDLPFPCRCIKDFWIILIHLTEKWESDENEDSFWSIYKSVQLILKHSLSSNLDDESLSQISAKCNLHFQKEDFIDACFWITSLVAPLFKYDVLGEINDYRQLKSGFIAIEHLVDDIVSNASVPEKHLRSILSHSIEFVSLWNVQQELLIPFTEFFTKKIENTFCVQSVELSGLSYFFKDSLAWLVYVSYISSGNFTSKSSSFDRFLHLFYVLVKHDTDNSLWRVVRGRIFCKYFPRKIKEMSETGLQNTFSLFLIIANSSQHEIGEKICEFASIVQSTANYRKQLIAWKAVFVLLCIYQEQNQNLQDIITLITKFFDSASVIYSDMSQDKMHKGNIMNLLTLYIDNMREILRKHLYLNPSLHQLITKGFSSLLPACSISQTNYILQAFKSILLEASKSIDSNGFSGEGPINKMIEAIFNHIYFPLQKIAISDNPPVVTSDIAVALTKIVALFPSSFSHLSYDLCKIFMFFGCNENVNCIIIGHYLSSILDTPDVMDKLRLKVKDFDVVLFQSWLKCTIFMHKKSDVMDNFMENLLKSNLKFVCELNLFDITVSDHMQASLYLYKRIGERYNNCDLQEKELMARTVQQMFKMYAFHAANKIKKATEREYFTHVFKLISHLILECSTVLHHHVTSDYILLQLLDKTIYPQTLFPQNKILQSAVTNSVKEYLPNILRGLFKLEYQRDKPVEKEIRDITIFYVCSLPPNNPIVKLLLDSLENKPDGLTLEAYVFILEKLKPSFLSSSTEKRPSILGFYREVFKQAPIESRKEISDVLLKCCLELLMRRNDDFSETLKATVREILSHFRENVPYLNTKALLAPVVQWLVLEKLPWAVVRGFSVLDIFVDYLPRLIVEMMSFFTSSVETLERNRGSGEDMLLRDGLQKMVFKVQQKLSSQRKR